MAILLVSVLRDRYAYNLTASETSGYRAGLRPSSLRPTEVPIIDDIAG
jgi:hypothetical protein